MIVVTGGAGFIGSNLVAALNARGADVVVCDWLRQGDKWRNLQKAVFADFVFPAELEAWLKGRADVEAVFHMGAISATTATNGDETIEKNFRFSLRLLDICAAQKIPLLYASSAAVYGDGAQGFEDESSPEAILALKPLNLYGWSKRQFDFVVADRLARGLPTPLRCAGFRFFNVFGPNEYHKGDMQSVIAKIFPKVRDGLGVELFKSHREGIGDGDQRRDFIYVKDVVAAMLWFLDHGGPSGVYNLGSGVARSFRDVAEAVFDALGKPRKISYIDMPPAIRDGYQYFTQASLSHMRRIGYEAPFTSLEAAVGDYVNSYLAAADPYR